jgi:pilus assembly protein Flp/PilA
VGAIRRTLRRLLANERAATAIEYGLIAGLIAVAISAALSQLGGGSRGMWTQISTKVDTAMSGASS